MRITKALISLLLVLSLMLSLASCLEDLPFGDKNDGGGVSNGGGASNGGGDGKPKDTLSASTNDKLITDGDMQIHFLELGNKYTGDCTYIKVGDVDILIDAGSKASSIKTIDAYLSGYVTDGTLEYVIVTHAHEDHYAGFATNEKTDSIFDLYECETIIDFAQTEKGKKDKTQYKNYIRERDAEIEKGAKHYTAAECVEMGGKFTLAEGITMTVLDSYYYYNVAKSENDHSVCTLFESAAGAYLFTGDLEAEGEEKLVEMNELPRVKLYKAGHHGSKTSSSDALLDAIRPEIVCVCCCAGSPQYTDVAENQFPTQQFIDRVSKHTDAVYVTTLCKDYKEGKFESFNGNIVIVITDTSVSVVCSRSADKLRETKWFEDNRIMPKAWK